MQQSVWHQSLFSLFFFCSLFVRCSSRNKHMRKLINCNVWPSQNQIVEFQFWTQTFDSLFLYFDAMEMKKKKNWMELGGKYHENTREFTRNHWGEGYTRYCLSHQNCTKHTKRDQFLIYWTEQHTNKTRSINTPVRKFSICLWWTHGQTKRNRKKKF